MGGEQDLVSMLISYSECYTQAISPAVCRHGCRFMLSFSSEMETSVFLGPSLEKRSFTEVTYYNTDRRRGN